MNCLNQAISEERIHQVRLLLSMDVDSEMRDKNDFERTPLIKSCLVKNHEPALKLLKILLKFKVSINTVDALGRSALHYACATGKSEVAKVLMNEDGIELNTQDNEGRTPLMLACAEGHLVMARVLMAKLVKFDLEIDLRDNHGYTALLLAIRSEHYDVAHDLVRYANACITLRDNERFMNAAEWLKFNLEERRRMIHGTKDAEEPRRSPKGTRTPSKKDRDKENRNETAGDVPILTLTKDQTDTDEFASDTAEGTKERIGTATSAAAISGLLFEPDPYGAFIRPTSSEKRTSTGPRPPSSGQQSTARPPSSGQQSTARPMTGASVASSVGTQRFSASSRTRKMNKMEKVQEESAPTPSATPLVTSTPPAVATLKREHAAESTVSFVTSRGSRRSWKVDDLESIIEDPNSRQPSRAGGRDSVARSHSRLERSISRTPGSNRSKSPFTQSGRKSKSDNLDEEKSSEIYAIQKLKQALRDKTRRKITRASTAVFRPSSGTPSEQWMTAIIKGSKRPTANPKTASVPSKAPEQTRSPPPTRKQSLLSVNADTNSIVSANESRKHSMSQMRETSAAMKLLHASSNLSLDTLLSESDITASTTYFPTEEKSRKSKGSNQLRTIFRLYTDSCLWKPPTRKPASLSVQINTENSEKMTINSEISDDLTSIDRYEGTLGSNADSIPPVKPRPESKIGPRSRLASSSAVSRISKGSRNAGSAGGRSVASRHAD